MIPLDDVLSFGARQHFDNLIDAEVYAALFAYAVDARKKFLPGQSSVIGLARGKAIVAAATVALAKVFAEVTQQSDATALTAFGEIDHLPELGRGDLSLLLLGHLVDEPRVFDCIAGAEKQKAFARQAIAAGATGLLVEAFDILGQIVMDDEANVRFVDAHAESDRRADHAHFVTQEVLLIL